VAPTLHLQNAKNLRSLECFVCLQQDLQQSNAKNEKFNATSQYLTQFCVSFLLRTCVFPSMTFNFCNSTLNQILYLQSKLLQSTFVSAIGGSSGENFTKVMFRFPRRFSINCEKYATQPPWDFFNVNAASLTLIHSLRPTTL
jgi:hypothetical protein